MPRLAAILLLLRLLLLLPADITAATPPAPPLIPDDGIHRVSLIARLLDPTLADGFDSPATIRGPKPATVRAIADGLVLAIHPEADTTGLSTIEIEHRYLENGRVHFITSRLTGLKSLRVQPGDHVTRRQPIATAATTPKLTLHPDAAADSLSTLFVSDFIRDHRRLLVPARQPAIVIAIKNEYRLCHCEKGRITRICPIALGQRPLGPKGIDGDNCTPEGEYRIVQKALGPFEGRSGPYLGAAWLRINYPNTADARYALASGLITPGQATAIITAVNEQRTPPQDTPLGGGIGIHGWASDWPDGPQDLTWGCLSLRNADLLALYALVPKGTPIIIHP